jgi:hypothetical protein
MKSRAWIGALKAIQQNQSVDSKQVPKQRDQIFPDSQNLHILAYSIRVYLLQLPLDGWTLAYVISSIRISSPCSVYHVQTW